MLTMKLQASSCTDKGFPKIQVDGMDQNKTNHSLKTDLFYSNI